MELSQTHTHKHDVMHSPTLNPVASGTADMDSDDDVTSHQAPVEQRKNEKNFVFTSSFDEWIVKYGILADHDLFKHGKTFVDECGTVRYVENWHPVELHSLSTTSNGMRDELNATGCLRMPIKIMENLEHTDSAPAKSSFSISFLMDFRALWEYFDHDTTDELAQYAPLFRMYVELFFHVRTTQSLLLTSSYELVVHLIVDARYNAYAPALSILNDFTIIFETLLYLALVVLFKGYVFPPSRPELLHREEMQKRRTARRPVEQRKHSLHWLSTINQVVRNSLVEFNKIWKSVKQSGRSQSSNVQKFVPFYDLLNISLKFLTKHTNNIGDKLNLNRRTHNAKLLLILFFMPMYYVVVTFAPPFAPYRNYVEVCQENGNDSYKCLNAQWVFYLTFGYATHMLRRYVFSSAVLLSLTGLSFGAEIAHCLTDSWIYRFGPLRRLDSTGSSTESTPLTSAGGNNGPPRTNTSDDSFAVSSKAQVNMTHRPGATALCRPLKSVPLETTMAGAASLPPEEVNFGPVPTDQVLPYLQRDSYEHYLFIREFMAIASRSWSPVIVTFIFFAAFLVVTFSFLAVAYSDRTTDILWVYYAVWISIRLFIWILYPIISLAHANAYVYALREQFLVAAPEDFAVIGGRDSWLEYLDKVPAMWTIYGVWITWDRLTGLLWTAIAGIGAIAISVASANA